MTERFQERVPQQQPARTEKFDKDVAQGSTRLDNRGTGWSRSAPYPFTIADMADDARDVLRACRIDRAAVLGQSMGGMIAQELAIKHSEFVDKLVLAATRPPASAYIAPSADMFSHAS